MCRTGGRRCPSSRTPSKGGTRGQHPAATRQGDTTPAPTTTTTFLNYAAPGATVGVQASEVHGTVTVTSDGVTITRAMTPAEAAAGHAAAARAREQARAAREQARAAREQARAAREQARAARDSARQAPPGDTPGGASGDGGIIVQDGGVTINGEPATPGQGSHARDHINMASGTDHVFIQAGHIGGSVQFTGSGTVIVNGRTYTASRDHGTPAP